MSDHEILPVHPVTGLTALAVIGGRPVWPVMGGDGTDEPTNDRGDGDEPTSDQDHQDGGGEPANDQDDGDQDKPLGPAGEKALKAEKDRRRAEARRRRELEAELAALKNSGSKDDPETIRREATQAATAKANTRLLRAEVRAAAAGKFADPRDALRFLDLDQFEVGEDGDVDADEIVDAIDDLLKNKPYLAARATQRFQGTGDGGSRNGDRPKQITSREDLAKMSPAERLKAHQEGRLKNLLQK